MPQSVRKRKQSRGCNGDHQHRCANDQGPPMRSAPGNEWPHGDDQEHRGEHVAECAITRDLNMLVPGKILVSVYHPTLALSFVARGNGDVREMNAPIWAGTYHA